MNIIVSSCFKYPTRYDGKDQNKPEMQLIIKLLESKGANIIYVCPEVVGGLSTPRDPAEIVGDKVITCNGTDVTSEFTCGAEYTLKLAKRLNVKHAILKAGSPSCGSKFIYDGTFSSNKVAGMGITSKLLMDNGINVYSEHDISEINRIWSENEN